MSVLYLFVFTCLLLCVFVYCEGPVTRPPGLLLPCPVCYLPASWFLKKKPGFAFGQDTCPVIDQPQRPVPEHNWYLMSHRHLGITMQSPWAICLSLTIKSARYPNLSSNQMPQLRVLPQKTSEQVITPHSPLVFETIYHPTLWLMILYVGSFTTKGL